MPRWATLLGPVEWVLIGGTAIVCLCAVGLFVMQWMEYRARVHERAERRESWLAQEEEDDTWH